MPTVRAGVGHDRFHRTKAAAGREEGQAGGEGDAVSLQGSERARDGSAIMQRCQQGEQLHVEASKAQ